MNNEIDGASAPPADPQHVATPPLPPMQLLSWSIRRELWENRSIYIAPLVVAGLVLFGFVISLNHLPERRRALLLLDPAAQHAAVERGYDIAAIAIFLTAFIVGFFYCLDALYGERRDRSILFWKSLPVSDLTTVLSKASIPLVVLPVVAFVIILATQLVMLTLSTIVLLANDLGGAMLWTPWFPMVVLLYGLAVLTLWLAPIYGWLLLVSAWARRTTFLWAVLPPLALCVVEKIAFNTSYLASVLKNRLTGFAPNAFDFSGHWRIESFAQLTPAQFLSAPGLWTGLVFAALFLAAAVRMRRYRDPI